MFLFLHAPVFLWRILINSLPGELIWTVLMKMRQNSQIFFPYACLRFVVGIVKYEYFVYIRSFCQQDERWGLVFAPIHSSFHILLNSRVILIFIVKTLLVKLTRYFSIVAEADYTLDDSFWNEESPVGEW